VPGANAKSKFELKDGVKFILSMSLHSEQRLGTTHIKGYFLRQDSIGQRF
jgi:hypothetical protein